MKFTPTTATLVEKLKREAKTLAKTPGTTLTSAQDTVAKRNGYEHWKHLTACREKSGNSKTLPKSLQVILDDARANEPVSDEILKAFAAGFVFAMDVKDAQELSETTTFDECSDGWCLAAQDLWSALIHSREEDGEKSLLEVLSAEELVDVALDDMQNFRFFRFVGKTIPQSLEDAYKHVHGVSFFSPTHFWLAGEFINIREIPEIRVDGEVVVSTTQGVQLLHSDEQ